MRRDAGRSEFHHRAAAREAGDGASLAGEPAPDTEGYDGYDVASGEAFGLPEGEQQSPADGRGGVLRAVDRSAGGGDDIAVGLFPAAGRQRDLGALPCGPD